MIGLNEVGNRLGSLAKHKKEWKRMGVNCLSGLVEKRSLKKLRSWSENYLMEMVRNLQTHRGFLY